MQIDLKTVAIALGVGGTIIGMITTWNDVRFRLEKAEEEQQEQE